SEEASSASIMGARAGPRAHDRRVWAPPTSETGAPPPAPCARPPRADAHACSPCRPPPAAPARPARPPSPPPTPRPAGPAPDKSPRKAARTPARSPRAASRSPRAAPDRAKIPRPSSPANPPARPDVPASGSGQTPPHPRPPPTKSKATRVSPVDVGAVRGCHLQRIDAARVIRGEAVVGPRLVEREPAAHARADGDQHADGRGQPKGRGEKQRRGAAGRRRGQTRVHAGGESRVKVRTTGPGLQTVGKRIVH